MRVRRAFLVSIITLSALAYSPIVSAAELSTLEARQVAQSVVQSFMKAYDTRDPKAIGALFIPDAMEMPISGAVMNGRAEIERGHVSVIAQSEGVGGRLFEGLPACASRTL
jgi:hypothetical protein